MVGGEEQLVAGFLQVLRHGQAHDAGADESDLGHENVSWFRDVVVPACGRRMG
ncbi:hypothetical protein D3C76_1478090 [compost metagenome]